MNHLIHIFNIAILLIGSNPVVEICFPLHALTLISSQNPHPNLQNMDASPMVKDSIPDNIDTLDKDISLIRRHVESISNNTEIYINESQKETVWNKKKYEKEIRYTIIGIALSLLNIVAVVLIYIITRSDTNKQIKQQHEDIIMQINSQNSSIEKQIAEQHKDTERQIKQQHELSEKQINKMQKNSDSRDDKLSRIGIQIQNSTSKISKSVEHFEQRYIVERDKEKVENAYSSVVSNHEALYKELERDYDHFIKYSNNSIIHQKASSLKTYIRNISKTLSNYSKDHSIPDPSSYLNTIDDVVDRPNFLNKPEQIEKFKDEGDLFLNQVSNCMKTIFNLI